MAYFSDGLVGVNLTSTGTAMTTVAAPNATHSMVGPTDAFNYRGGGDTLGSYATAVMTSGEVLNDSSGKVYTMAHEPISGNVFVTNHGSGRLHVTSENCFKSIANCTGGTYTTTFDVGAAGIPQGIGPLSSLNDGRVLGLHRIAAKESGSTLYMFTLKDPNDRSKGLNTTKIKDIPGDTYMYTDFTGSMSAAREESRTLDLSKATGFKPGGAVYFPRLKWKELPGTPTTWTGLTLAVACTTKGKTGIDIDLSQTPGCSGVFDEVRIQVKPAEAGVLVFSKTREFVFSGQQ